MGSLVKTADEIRRMAAGGRILGGTLQAVQRAAKEGTTLLELDALAEKLIHAAGAEPAFLGYKPHGAARPFPRTLCASLNETVVHGVPTARILKNGDVLKLDLGVRYGGYYTDAAVTLAIGEATRRVQKLIRITNEALMNGVGECRAGRTLGDMGYIIHRTVTRAGFKVIRGLTGHGIGKELHEEPSVPNEGTRGKGMPIREGFVLAIEVMTGMTSGTIVQKEDDSYATADGGISAHVEHTIAVTKDGSRILTVVQ